MNQIAERIQCFACVTRLCALSASRLDCASHGERRYAKQPEVQAADQQRIDDQPDDESAGGRGDCGAG